MSLQSIGHFQKAIYEMLKTDSQLASMVTNIYLSAPQDAKYPFVLVNLVSLQDMSKYNKKIYDIDFEIAIFTRDRVQESVLKIADHIEILMHKSSIGVADAHIVSMRKNSIEWIRGQYNMSNKILMKYKGIIGN